MYYIYNLCLCCPILIIITARNEDILISTGNVENDASFLDECVNDERVITSDLLCKILHKQPESVLLSREIEDDINFEEIEIEELQEDALEYLGGYIIKKCFKGNEAQVYRDANSSTFTWVDEVSEGGLIKPSKQFIIILKQLEKVFETLNGNKISITQNYLKKHLLQSEKIECEAKVKTLFFRCRMYFRIKHLNNDNKKIKKTKRKYKKIIT